MSGHDRDWDDDDDRYDDDRHDDDDRYEDYDRYDDDRYDNDRYDNDSLDQYQFEVQNGQVVGVIEVENGRFERDRIEWDEQWSVQNGQVVKVERDDGYLETTVYADPDGDGLFTKVSETRDRYSLPGGSQPGGTTSDGFINDQFVGDAYWNDGYKFTITGSSVTGIVEIDDGFEQSRPIDWNESWSVQGNNVVRVETYTNFAETTVYADVDGDGIYSKVMESYAPLTASAPMPAMPLDTQVASSLSGANQDLITVFGDQGVVDDVYRIYKAAFDREADADGLGFWTAQAKLGATLTQISESFINSDEFQSIYGSNPSVESFVEGLYQNVLGRLPDTEGEQYWVQKLASSELTEAELLASFANSQENVANVEDAISAGIQYSAFVA